MRGLGGSALAAVLAGLGLQEAAAGCVPARKKCGDGDRCCSGATCRGGQCKCKKGLKDYGKTCNQCCTGNACRGNGDCQSGVCFDETCQAATCADGVRNRDESDVDCGGNCCSRCANGKRCVFNDDCASRVCDKCLNGCIERVCQPCTSQKDCRTRVCRNGVCEFCIIDDDCEQGRCQNDLCLCNGQICG